MIRGKNNLLLMDSHLEGRFSAEDVVVNLAFQCLQYEPRERPKTKDLVDTLSSLQIKEDVLAKEVKFNKFCFWVGGQMLNNVESYAGSIPCYARDCEA